MTREEEIMQLRLTSWAQRDQGNNYLANAIDTAIKALEQEPILDKIRAEIENDWQLKKYPSSPFSCGLRRAIEIIDKYKAESEDTE